TCPVCNEEHKDDEVKGQWGAGENHEKRKDIISKVLKQNPGISLSCSSDSGDIYQCTTPSLCPSCEQKHKENI
ncbi:410_t:CDS:2, partial [Racocetra persica]